MVIWRNMTRALSECLCCNEREGNQIRQFNQIAIKLHANKFTSKSNRKWRHIVYSLSILIGNRFAQCPWENHQYTSDVAHWKLITRMLKFLFSSFTQTNLVPSKSWLEHVPFYCNDQYVGEESWPPSILLHSWGMNVRKWWPLAKER